MSGMIGLRPVGRWVLLLTALLTAALLGALAAGFLAQRVSSQRGETSGGTMRACVSIHTGMMRYVSASATCNGFEYMIDWNQQGIPGDQGPQGLQGEQGERGPAGPPTYLDTYMVSERHNTGSSEGDEGDGGGGDGRAMQQVSSGTFMASCEAGDNLVAGGYELIADGDMETPPIVLAERPMVQTPGGGGEDGDGGEGPTETVESWLVSVQHDGGLTGLDVWAVCNVADEEAEAE